MEEEKKGFTSFLTPEAVAMITLACLVDGGEFLVNLLDFVAAPLGTILATMIDIIALLFIGGWMYFRSGTTASKAKAEQVKKGVEMAKKGLEAAKKGAKMAKAPAKWAKWLKWGSAVFEVGGVASSSFFPGWILAVILELKYGGS